MPRFDEYDFERPPGYEPPKSDNSMSPFRAMTDIAGAYARGQVEDTAGNFAAMTAGLPGDIGEIGSRTTAGLVNAMMGPRGSAMAGHKRINPESPYSSEALVDQWGNRDHPSYYPAMFAAPGPGEVGAGVKMAAKGLTDLPNALLAATFFHGSPHKFDIPSNDYMGTGEGAQAFGWGHYSGGGKGTGEYYRDQLTGYRLELDGTQIDPNNAPQGLEDIVQRAFSDPQNRGLEGVRDAAQGQIDTYKNIAGADEIVAENQAIIDRLDSLGDRLKDSQGHLYEYDIPDETIDKMLDWDAPLSEQPESVKEAFVREFGQDELDAYGDRPGSEWYKSMAGDDMDDRAASMELLEMGIPGIRYLDGSSRRGNRFVVDLVRDSDNVLVQQRAFDTKTQAQEFIDKQVPKGFTASPINEEGTRNLVLFDPENTVRSVKRDGEEVYNAMTSDQQFAETVLKHDPQAGGRAMVGGVPENAMVENPLGEYEWFKGSRHHDDLRVNPTTGLAHFTSDPMTAARFGEVQNYLLGQGNYFNPDNADDLAKLKKAFESDEALLDFGNQYDELIGDDSWLGPDLRGSADEPINRQDRIDSLREYFDEGVELGLYQTMESPAVLRWLKEQGYDGVFMREDDYGPMGLAVFDLKKVTRAD